MITHPWPSGELVCCLLELESSSQSTISTGAEQKTIMSSNTETTLGIQNGRGPIIGKFPQKANKPIGKTNVQLAGQPVLMQQVAVSQYSKPLTTAVHIISTSQTVICSAGQIHNSVVTTYTTTANLISTVRQQRITVQPQTSLKSGTYVIQGIPASQYNLIVSTPNQMSRTGTKMGTLPPASSATHYVTTTLHNSPQLTRTNSVGTPTVLTNYVIKQNPTSQPPHLSSPPQPSVSPAYSQPSVQPTHVQYILPSVRMQPATPAGKIQNHVIQMAIPGAVPPGSIQLTFTGTPGSDTSTPQNHHPVQQVQVSPQQVLTGKIQLQPIQGFKVVASPGKPQPSPAASPQLNVVPQTIQVINQTMPTRKQQAVPVVTQLVNLNQAVGIIATPHQQIQLQSVTLSQPVVSRAALQPSHNSQIQPQQLQNVQQIYPQPVQTIQQALQQMQSIQGIQQPVQSPQVHQSTLQQALQQPIQPMQQTQTVQIQGGNTQQRLLLPSPKNSTWWERTKLHSSSRHHAKSPSKSAHVYNSPHKNSATASFRSHRTTTSRNSVKEPPPSLSAELVGGKPHASKHEHSKIKKKHSIPVVEVERIPELTIVKKEKTLPSSVAGNYNLTNGAVKTESHLKLEESMKDIEIKDFKPPISPHQALSAPPSPTPAHTSPLPLSPALASEVDTAMSSILEPAAEAENEIETSTIAIATPLVTMTTTMVTTFSITKSATSVTNLTTTMAASSVFSYSGKLTLGGSHFNLGNVNYSDMGIQWRLNDEVDNKNTNNKNNNSVFLLKTNSSSSLNSPLKINSITSSKGFMNLKSSCSICGNLVIVSSSSAKTSVNVPPVVTSPPVNIITSASPAFKSNLIKSFSASGKLGGSGKSHRTGTGLKSGLSSEELMKKYPDIEKPEKIIPLKDREYDPNKHCGVIIAETGKACTRSLTCNSHALSLRRAVNGRRLPFDELLQEHREAKDAYLLAKKVTLISKSTRDKEKPKANLISNMSNKIISGVGQINQKSALGNSTGLFVTKPSLSNLHLASPSIRMDDIRSPPDKPPGKLLTDDEEEKEKDNSYITHHPWPIAGCSFGARYLSGYNGGFGCHLFGRRTDHLRSSLLDMLERHLQPPPPKKLCVGSNLSCETESQLNSKDPYDFGLPPGSQPHGIPVQQVNAVITSVPNKMIVKPKPNLNKQNSNLNLNVSKAKSWEGTAGTSFS